MKRIVSIMLVMLLLASATFMSSCKGEETPGEETGDVTEAPAGDGVVAEKMDFRPADRISDFDLYPYRSGCQIRSA